MERAVACCALPAAQIMECKLSVKNAKCMKKRCCQVDELPMIAEEHRNERLAEVCKGSPTPNSSVALNSFVPANRLTSVAAVLKASSIPAERLMHSAMHMMTFTTFMVILTGMECFCPGTYLGRWACRRSLTRWLCKRSRKTVFVSGFHCHT